MAMARLRFHRSLNDFLPPAQRHGKPRDYGFERRASIKDVIEALGVPHPEVAAILIDDQPTSFETLLTDGASVEVYPHEAYPHPAATALLRDAPPQPVRFVLDVHLGRLARYLRLLGFDSHWRNDFEDAELAVCSAEQGRILLTRDRLLLQRRIVTHGYFVRADDPTVQLEDVCARFDLYDDIAAFRRCARCNGRLQPVDKAQIIDRLEPKTKRYFEHFLQCDRCGQVYWQGSHFEHMTQWIEALKAQRRR